ncbi:MAG: alpha/beta hydrolase [Lentisphaeraceae bacterium]|nr:alpha/beta hydrolase [Lentisphaeraceae bacterium]
MKQIYFSLVITFFTISSAAQSKITHKHMSIKQDIVYETLGERKLHLDLFQPKNMTESTPLIIWIHGGGWMHGSKRLSPYRIAGFISKGFTVASVEYRLSGEAIFPAAITDCKAAVRFLRAHADKYKLDANNIGVWGSSAGGHLAAFLGTSGGVKEFDVGSNLKVSSKVQAVCDWFGPTDFMKMNDSKLSRMDHLSPKSPESRFLGGHIVKIPETVKKANPITYITKDDPPFSILHGDKDTTVIYNQSELLEAALKKYGVEVVLHKIEGQGHGFKGESNKKTMNMAIDFFSKTLGMTK